ncbi:MAG: lipoprotein-releasing system ATP-binding protein LolD [Candidatus Omnitrophota bacterium]|nr:MAG: lipoprotein-releasing system ATP-binding protein LolD [Candidatus Omnitrophota bacterium]
MLRACNIEKYYLMQPDKLHVLKTINLEIEKHEIVAVIGSSGAGKSTLLHTFGGLDTPSSGNIFIDGCDIYKLRDAARARLRAKKIGFVFQFYYLLPEFTALENVILPALVLGVKASIARQKAKDLLKELGLEKRMTHHPSQLSGGEQQRVAIVRALINDPDILICDEPTGNLDSETGSKICDLLLRLNKEKGYTILIATHSQALAHICPKTFVIKDGAFVE